jgi:hypothetical protein
MLMNFFSQVFFESNPVYDQTQGSGAVFFLLLRITLICKSSITNLLSLYVNTKINGKQQVCDEDQYYIIIIIIISIITCTWEICQVQIMWYLWPIS